jgi:hypothetical protein
LGAAHSFGIIFRESIDPKQFTHRHTPAQRFEWL